METERHPLKPFIPKDTKVLILGSFPPKRERWSMDFFYPNFQNDMWRIFGLIIINDKEHFVITGQKKFDKEKIVIFCQEKKIAMYDTASEIIRLKDNASDNFLKITKETDIRRLLSEMPKCDSVIVTGQKACEIVAKQFLIDAPKVGEKKLFHIGGRTISLYRTPSSSRAYPLALEKKAETYKKCLCEIGIIH